MYIGRFSVGMLDVRTQDQFAPDYKRLDAASYDEAAVEFDRLTERFSGPLAARMIDLAGLQRDDDVLDIGTGTGLVALRAGALAPKGRVIGIDHSAGMLGAALEKARRTGLGDTVTFRQMDAEQLDFPDQSFSLVLSLYALFHFPDPLAAVKQMHRVLRPGGRVVIGVGSGPSLFSWNGMREGMRTVSERVAVARGRSLTAPQFLLHLMRERGMTSEQEHQPAGSHSDVAELLRRAGFKRLYRNWQGHWEKLDPEEFWRLQVTYTSAARIRLQQALPAEVMALREEFLERCQQVQAKGGNLTYPHAAMFHKGTRV